MKSPTKITVEAVTAYRLWYVSEDGGLHALFERFEWPARAPAEALHFGAVDGFHAYVTPRQAWRGMGETWDEAPHLHLAVGAVALWGTVQRERDQYRATRAYPQTLWATFDGEGNRRCRLAADRYGIDFVARPLETDETCASENEFASTRQHIFEDGMFEY